MASDQGTCDEADGADARTPAGLGDDDTLPRAMASLKQGEDPLDKKLVKRALFPRRTTPVQIGRFQILSLVGRGGMGVVYAAYDDLLDRKVAVKVLLADTARDPALARSRLMREAQAMARLSHANIVTVHEVGQDDGQVFVAMEFVRGTTLEAWARQDRPWREVVATFVRAGRGLEAAHRAGFIHRDFKPANVMVGDDGTVKVLDFGLARAADDLERAPSDLPHYVAQADSHLTPLTRTGAVLGTPAYMSPEAHRGEPSTAASDQFSFCVSLYQCLYGAPPFDTTSLATLLADPRRGAVAPPPAGTPVPARVYRAIRRGLSLAPEDRFPSMTALLAALEHDPGAAHRRLAALAVTAVVTAAAGFAAASSGGSAPQRCPDASAELAGVWDGERAQAVRTGLSAIGSPAAADALTTVLRRIDAYAAAWVEMRNEACLSHAEARQPAALFDLRTACLDQRRAGLDTLVAALTQVDAAGLDSAVQASVNLPALARCADVEALTADIPPPDDPRLRLRVQAHREALARAQVREDAGQYALGRTMVEDVLADSSALAYEPLHAEALLRAGSLAMEAGDHHAAERAFADAMQTAVGCGHEAVAAVASSKHAFLRAVPLNQLAQAQAELPLAAALNRRVRHEVDLYAEFLNNLGVVEATGGELAAARQHWEEAVALRERHGRGETLGGLNTRANLGWLAHSERRDEDMIAIYTRTAALSEQLFGPHHAVHLRYAFLLAGGLGRLGRPREAIDRLADLEQRFDRLGNDYMHGQVLHMLALLEIDEGRLTAAREHLGRALAAVPESSWVFDAVLCERVHLLGASGDAPGMQREYDRAVARLPAPPDPLGRSYRCLLYNRAQALDALGRTAEALAPLEQILAALPDERTLETAEISLALGELRLELGLLDEAEADLRRSLAGFERVVPPGNLTIARNLLALAELALSRRRFADATDLAGQALALYGAVAEPDHLPVARARFARAQALTGPATAAPPEARADAEAALAIWRAKSRTEDTRRAQSWLAAHPAAPAL
ncbi:serine/threonine-protein kinase [Nannocystis sp. RBIL2]|uniref:serine/threonine-protein kinase n=1 Tax=Nannocystis sp. RBIL2 TaxID=2996788 RepID=UPI0022716CB6|nr:serine/threonine-protein kinase [Nannocystis sp. RBIL2]